MAAGEGTHAEKFQRLQQALERRDLMDMEYVSRKEWEELNKRVADLERKVQSQPKVDVDTLSQKIVAHLQKASLLAKNSY